MTIWKYLCKGQVVSFFPRNAWKKKVHTHRSLPIGYPRHGNPETNSPYTGQELAQFFKMWQHNTEKRKGSASPCNERHKQENLWEVCWVISNGSWGLIICERLMTSGTSCKWIINCSGIRSIVYPRYFCSLTSLSSILLHTQSSSYHSNLSFISSHSSGWVKTKRDVENSTLSFSTNLQWPSRSEIISTLILKEWWQYLANRRKSFSDCVL
jgi:hypothetical protein